MSMTSQPLASTLVEENLTISNVRAWAQAVPASTPLGLAAKPWECPLARFCFEVLHCSAFMERSFFQVHDAAGTYALPAWAKRFIYVIDTCFTPGTAVTAAQVLTALDDAERFVMQQERERQLREWEVAKATMPKWDISSLLIGVETTEGVVAHKVAAEEKVLVPA